MFLVADGAEAVAYFHYEEWQIQPVILNRFLQIYPIYNDSGSWFHGRLGIGYVRWMLLLEDTLSLAAEAFLFRYIAAICEFFSLAKWELMLVSCGMSATVYRLFTRLRDVYVLDYLYIRGRGVSDLPDLYLFLAMVGLFIWVLRMWKSFYSFKRKKTKGMSLLQ